MKPIGEVLAAHTSEWMVIPGVTGTGEGARAGRAIVVIYVARSTPELARRLPRTVDGYDVEVREIGTIRALGDSAR